MPFSGKRIRNRAGSEIPETDNRLARKFGVIKPKDPFQVSKQMKEINRNKSSVFMGPSSSERSENLT